MTPIIRTWLAFAAIGTGLIHVALVIGSPLALGIVLAVLGLVEFGWGVLTFARETVLFPTAAVVVAIVPVLAWGLLLVTSTAAETPAIASSLGLLPLAVASLFELFIVALLGVHLRRRALTETKPTAPGLGRYVLGLLVGAFVVAGLTTPALAATEAGTGSAPLVEQTDEPVFILPDHGH